jgi:hypothetical protein
MAVSLNAAATPLYRAPAEKRGEIDRLREMIFYLESAVAS